MKSRLVLVVLASSALFFGFAWAGDVFAGCPDAKYLEAERLFQQALESKSSAQKAELLEQAFATCPDHGNFAQGYYALGKLYYDRNDKEKSLEWLLQANRFKAPLLEMSAEEFAQTNLLLGNLYRERSQDELALIHLNIYKALTKKRTKEFEQNLITNADAFFSVVYSPKMVEKTLTADKAITEADRPKVNRLEIYFNYAKSVLDEDAKKRLDSLGQGLQSDTLSGSTMVLEGHTDESGGDKPNCKLGLKRAEAVKEYLEKQLGINNIALVAVSYGKTSPVMERKDHKADEWAAIDRFNRRVVIWNGGTSDAREKDIKVEALVPKSPCSP